MASPRILLVDDDAAIRLSLSRYLASTGYDVVVAETAAAARELFGATAVDAAVLDYELPDGNALDLLRAFKAQDPLVPLVVLTGFGSIDLAVRALKEGAENFLTKPPDMTALAITLQRALQNRRLVRRQVASAVGAERSESDPFLGASPVVRRLADLAGKVAASDAPVLITGETGSGKGVLARWLHANGPRSEEPFVDLNCAGLSRDLLESELFGHEKGAFTSASAAKAGLLEAAHRGTLFLDEIGDMDPVIQPRLLKAIEEGVFRRLGDVRDRKVDVRLVAATNRDLGTMVAEGSFRSDLLYRINTVPIRVPPLRERPEDIRMLARRLLEERPACRGRKLTDAAISRLEGYAWPGNVRELRNVLERAALLAPGELIDVGDLLFDSGPGRAPAAGGDELGLTLEQVERRHIERVLADVGGKVAAAADRLAVPRSTLYQKLKLYGLGGPRLGREE